MTLPVALSGTDVIGQAKTGTGKTLGFGLPLLERVTVPADVEAGRARPEQLTDTPQALVVVPTRELCTQVTNDLLTAGKVRNVRVLAIYGGRAYEPQVEALQKGVDVVVGTPGRLLDLAGQKKLDLSHVKALVLDEADEMLDLGFLPDVEKIMELLPAKRQTMLFSATMPGAVIGLARRYMSRPTHIRATSPDDEGATHANIAQHVYRAHSMDKPEMVARILQAEGRGLAMIFCRTKRTAADIAEQLQRRGFASGAVHGDLGQGAREQALRAFRNGKVDVLVCTDVAARGIDVEGVTHVINYQSPEDEKTYLHRIGRTGRAGNSGTAITLVDWDDIPRWQLINKALELDFNDPVETYSSSPHLFEELNIPAGTKGILPRTERTRAGLDAEEIEDLGETGGRGGRGARTRTEERPARTRTPRERRRTRGGAPLAEGAAPAAAPAAEESPEQSGPRVLRRRRRTRAGASSEAPAAAVTPVESAAAPAEAAVDTAEAVEAKPRRRRSRAAARPADAAVAVAEAPVRPEPAVVVVPAEAEAEPRRRTRKVTPVEAPAEAPATAEAPVRPRRARVVRPRPAVAEPDFQTPESAAARLAEAARAAEAAPVAEAKPRRTRAEKVAEAAVDTAVATAEVAEVAEAKPRRTRAKKVAEAAVDTAVATAEVAEVAEAKPRRTRAKKVAEAAEDTAEATEAKPRRTRKATTAKPAETTEATEATEAEAKPRRTRAKKVTETAAETAVATAEATEAKPRRTRKAATAKPAETAVATAEVAEVTEAKPRRTRAKKVAEAPADTAEAAPKPRRTRAKKVTEAVPETA
ncbi:DEAD/DEAH box helicase [Streptomyces sannanensis]